MLTLDYSKTNDFIDIDDLKSLENSVLDAHDMLHNKTGEGFDCLGWVDLPTDFDRLEFEKIKKSADKIKSDSDVFIIIGVGGSFLGARAAIEMLSHSFHNTLPKSKRKAPEIYFAGHNCSSAYISDLLEIIEDKDVSLNVVSKSGTTTEPAIAFRLFKKFMEKKYGRVEASKRIYITTDKEKGSLISLAKEEGYETFVIPDDIGGRFSVLTAVGLLPIAVCGAEIDKVIEGAAAACIEYGKRSLLENDCYLYAAIRSILYKKNKTIEILANYEPALNAFTEWWKQLFSESEGKNQKGIFPAGVDYSTDLHSMGQYIQDGLRNIFETVIWVDEPKKKLKIINCNENKDGLNYLADREIDFVNRKAFEGALLAHTDGGVPNIIIRIPLIDEFNFGSLVYFFEKSCAISGYIAGINPFNQPGVEEYKNNMFALLGRPGYEENKKILEERLKK
jgi:glucose-6-phosphate isomerase